MSAEADLRAVLIAHAPLVAVVPAKRIAVDAADTETPRPFIIFTKENESPFFGIDNTLHAESVTLSVQIIGQTRENAIAVRDLVKAALLAEGVPWSGGSGGYDPESDIEAEVLTVEWIA